MEDNRLLDEAERRWTALERARPELAEAIALQRRLVANGLALAAAIDDLPLPATGEASHQLVAKRPILTGAGVDLDGAPFKPFVLAFCDDLAQGGAGGPAERLRVTLERGEIDIASLLKASLMRQQTAIRMKANQMSVAPDVLWLVAELGAAPLAHKLQRRYLHDAAAEDGALRAALDGWDEGSCPACGSWPALAEEVSGSRHLRCSFCGAAWQTAVQRCIYCAEAGQSFVVAALADTEKQTRRVELCRTCGGYLKSLTAAASTPFALLPVIDLASSDLDVGAVDRGYIRFSMREFNAV